MTELILGTAQLGEGYGITNAVGRLDDDQVRALLARAAVDGVVVFDTAASYGDAVDRLGRFAAPGAHYITKAAIEADSDREQLFGDALARLRVPALDALLLHRTSDLASPHLDAALDILRAAREAEEIGRIGVSVYDRDELELAVERFPDLDVVQLPGSAVDRRLIDDPFVRELHDRGVQIHVRSVFLQGLLLAMNGVPSGFEGLAPALEAIDEHRQHSGPTSRLGILLRAVRDAPAVDAAVVGATTPGELAAIAFAWGHTPPSPTGDPLPEVPLDLLDPRTWPAR